MNGVGVREEENAIREEKTRVFSLFSILTIIPSNGITDTCNARVNEFFVHSFVLKRFEKTLEQGTCKDLRKQSFETFVEINNNIGNF